MHQAAETALRVAEAAMSYVATCRRFADEHDADAIGSNPKWAAHHQREAARLRENADWYEALAEREYATAEALSYEEAA